MFCQPHPSRHAPVGARHLCRAALLVAGLGWATGAAAQDLEIVTEEYAPANFTGEDGAIAGIVTDTVRLMAERAGLSVSMEMLPFKRGYALVQGGADRCFMALWRIPAREDDFTWVGPILKDGYALFARAGEAPDVDSIEDSFGHPTGAVAGWGSTEAMQEAGHPNLEIVSLDIANMRKLAAGRLDLWLSGLLSAPWRAARQDLALERVLVVDEVDLSLACHPDTDPDTIAGLSAALQALTDEGAVQAIRARYLDTAASEN
ncbi:substrate-binding periplasmic protein [Tranquillimonas rosea]|uniref:substrate-binding periplasmic protein n=1 Tax=Tranquillimonas rosea TaxID=641238 RepID=UPI003BAB11C4